MGQELVTIVALVIEESLAVSQEDFEIPEIFGARVAAADSGVEVEQDGVSGTLFEQPVEGLANFGTSIFDKMCDGGVDEGFDYCFLLLIGALRGSWLVDLGVCPRRKGCGVMIFGVFLFDNIDRGARCRWKRPRTRIRSLQRGGMTVRVLIVFFLDSDTGTNLGTVDIELCGIHTDDR